VGLYGVSLVILSSTGQRLNTETFRDFYFQSTPDVKLTLTGLFRPIYSSPLGIGKPNIIGIGVERNQPDNRPLYGLLLNADGSFYRKLEINTLSDSRNKSAGVYPVAAFIPPSATGSNPIALAVVSQNEFQLPSTDSVSNGIRRYDLTQTTSELQAQWLYRIAPRAYVQAPALLKDSPESTLVSLSTAAYVSEESMTVNPDQLDQTISNKQYSVTVRVDSATRPLPHEVRQVPTTDPPPPGEAHSYIVRLGSTHPQATDGVFRLITENHDSQRPGNAEIRLTTAKTVVTTDLGRIVGSANYGWSIVQADVDGTAPDGQKYKNNPGNEIIAALRSLDGADVANDSIYVIRYSFLQNYFGDVVPRMAFSGRLMGAGDLVTDPYGRDELVIANGSSLSVLQLRNYNDPLIDIGDDKLPFTTLASFTLDSRILNVAIADLEGDGDNDLVVSTEKATYAIGKPIAEPFDTIRPQVSETCSPDTFNVSWRRKVGGEGTVTVKLLGDNKQVTVLDTNFPATRDTFTVITNTLAEGTYRLIVQDNDLPTLIDTSDASFTIHTPSIAQFHLADTPFDVGQSVSFETTLQCIDDIHLEQSFIPDQWEEVEAEITPDGAKRTISYTLPCPPNWSCRRNDTVKVWLRLVSNIPGVAPRMDSLSLAVPSRTLNLVPPAGPDDTTQARNRLLTWTSTDFDCQNLLLSYSTNGGADWNKTSVPNDGEDSIRVPVNAFGRVLVRLCCGDGTVCDYGITEFGVRELPGINFVAPNPFNPNRPVSDYGDGAAIIYRLQRGGTVRITIFDASRSVTAVLADGEAREEATTYVELWDGRNGQGNIVANGTYICIIESSASERIVLPIIVIQY
jgi:hypothetical protein